MEPRSRRYLNKILTITWISLMPLNALLKRGFYNLTSGIVVKRDGNSLVLDFRICCRGMVFSDDCNI